MNNLEFIKKCMKERKILWTYHVNMRLEQRLINRNTILDSIDSFQIIESYPEDKYLPSYLLYAKNNDLLFHLLVAVDIEYNNIRVVTAYVPSLEKWMEDYKTRRR